MRLLRVLDSSRNWRVALSIKLILLTGARKREILDARWDYINAQARVLTLPNSKSGNPRHIALSDAALSLLDRLPREDDVPWLFFNPQSKQPLNNLHPAWVNLRTQAGLPDLRIHDLRHSFASFWSTTGAPFTKCRGCLDIKVPERQCVTRIWRLAEWWKRPIWWAAS
jgi:Phage integrase family.